MTKKKPDQKKSSATDSPAESSDAVIAKPKGPLKGIPVSRLDILERNHVDVGLSGFASSQAHSLNVMAHEGMEIEYRPWMRHHVVTFKGKQTFIPESWCHWRPLTAEQIQMREEDAAAHAAG